MMIIAWLLSITLFCVSCLLLGYLLKNAPSAHQTWQQLKRGFNEAWGQRPSPSRKRSYALELYVWDICEDCEDCEECVERSQWKPMDIADWMAEGLPGTPEAKSSCRHECFCQLIPYQPNKPQHPFTN